MTDRQSDLPDLVPALMVNEFAYCKLLFYLEWVQGRFEDNADTVDGRYQHRAVDVERGRAPGPEAADDFREARSVLVSSERLGLIARADLIEGEHGEVVPVWPAVEACRASPPAGHRLGARWPRHCQTRRGRQDPEQPNPADAQLAVEANPGDRVDEGTGCTGRVR